MVRHIMAYSLVFGIGLLTGTGLMMDVSYKDYAPVIEAHGTYQIEQPKHTGPFKTKEEFVSTLKPLAEKLSKEIGIDVRIIIAQSAIETGWGAKVKGNSFFGVKAHGKPGISFITHEVINGKKIKMWDSFRAYSSLEESVQDYGKFLQTNPRYRYFLAAKTVDEQIKALGKSGYATDPNYAKKVKRIVKGPTLKRLGGYT